MSWTVNALTFILNNVRINAKTILRESGQENLTTFKLTWKLGKQSLRISSVNVTKLQETADLVTFTKEIPNGKFHILCSELVTPNIERRYNNPEGIQTNIHKKWLKY